MHIVERKWDVPNPPFEDLVKRPEPKPAEPNPKEN